jgi:hypothetical protein
MDRIFAEGLQNYEVTPPAHIWKNIQNQKRKALFLYRLKMASVILLLMISGGAYFMFSHYNITQPKIKSVNTTEKAYKNLDLTENKNTEPIMIEQKSVKLKPTYSQAINQSQKINRKAYKNSASQKTVHNNINVDNIVMTPMDNEFNLIAKNKIKLRYLIYPSLTQYVYTTKRFKPKYIKVNDKKEVEKLNHHFSIEIGGGPSYAFRKLSGDENGLRNESESSLISLLD